MNPIKPKLSRQACSELRGHHHINTKPDDCENKVYKLMNQNAKTTIDEPPIFVGESSFFGIKLTAIRNPDMIFTSITHGIDLHLLQRSYKKINKSKSAGVDKITAKDYSEHLDRNLFDLYTRLIRGKYKACPVKRIWIDKEGCCKVEIYNF